MAQCWTYDRKYILLFLVYALLVPYLVIEGYITGIAVRLWLHGERAPPGSPWPQPRVWQNSSSLKTIDPTDFLFASSALCDVIQQAFVRYGNWMFIDPEGSVDSDLPALGLLYVNLRGCEEGYPGEDMDEYYNLTIDGSATATLSANSEWGVLRGLETFSQLVTLTDNKKYNINETFIEDSPRFSYRGLMIDTARHYITMPVILNILDGMSFDKLNVLHWHIVDDQSFPFESRTFPNMSKLGAFSPNHTYSREDVTTVVEEARLRGIRVIPEFDTPGHSYSWGKAFPDLLTPCWGDGPEGGPYVPKYGVHGDMETVNPSQEYTYQLMSQFWQEVIEDFPDEYVHLGLDEAYYSCWQSNPNISEWMSEQGFTEYNQVEAYYTTRLIDIVEELGAKVVVWQDPIDKNVTLSNSSMIAVWKDSSFGQPGQFQNWTVYMERITRLGYSTYLLAPWYLNIIKYGQDWQDYYLVDPHDFTDDPDLQSRVKGGSATAWAEYLDGTNILSLLWPRLSAMAERLWSSGDVKDIGTAQFRLDQHRCRFLRRGIPAKPILPGYCGDYEWNPKDEL